MRDYPTAQARAEAVETLICSVEDLLWRLTTAADSEMGRLRDRAKNALAAAKAAVADNAARLAEETDPFATANLDAYVREWPRMALAAAGMLGLVIGVWAHRSTHRP